MAVSSDQSKLNFILINTSAAISVLTGLITLIGWFAGFGPWLGFIFYSIPMAPNTAFLFMLAGLSLLLYQPGLNQGKKLLILILTLIIIGISAVTLAGIITGINFKIDNILFHTEAEQAGILIGRMSSISAVSFLLLGISLILFIIKKYKYSGILSFLVLFNAWTQITAYFYGAPLIFSNYFIPMALPSAIAFLLLSTSFIISAGNNVWPMSSFSGNSSVARLFRRIVPLVLLIMTFIGWAGIQFIGRNDKMTIYALTLITLTGSLLVFLIIDFVSGTLRSSIEKSEIRLRKSEEHYRHLLENGNDAIYIHGIDEKGNPENFTEVNEIACTRLGYTKKEMMQMSPQDLDSPELSGKLADTISKIVNLDHYIFETVHLTKDKKCIPVEINAHCFTIEGKKMIMSIARDISERKLAENALQQKTALLEAQLNSSIDAILIIDKNGKMILQNQRNVDLWKVPPEIADDPGNQIQLEYVAQMTKNPQEFKEKASHLHSNTEETSRDEFELIDGTILDRYSAPVIGENGQNLGRIWIFRDVTEQKFLDKKIRESEGKYKYLFNNAEVGMFRSNLDGSAILDLNEKYLKIYERTREEMLANPAINHCADPEEWEEMLRSLNRDGFVSNFECKMITKNGKVKSCLTSVRLYQEQGILEGSIIDITERQMAEEAVKKSDERLRFALEISGIGAWDLDLTDHTAVRSIEHDRIFGYQELLPEWTYEMFLEHVLAEDREMVDYRFHHAIETKSDWNFECRILRTDGVERWIWAVGRCQADNTGTLSRMTGIVQDITTRKEIENRILILNRDLEERVRDSIQEIREKDHFLITQSRLAAMGEMVHNIAHQWRQPLNALGITIQNYKLAFTHNKLNLEYLDKTQATSMKLIMYMSQTINDFKNFFKPDKEKNWFSAQDILKKTIGLIDQSLADNNIVMGLTVDLDKEILGYPNEFGQVILNLIQNSKDALLERKIVEPKINIHVFEEDGKSFITISDNAGGIPAELLNKIFEPYFTTKESGTGIGLYMSKMIIENNMNGQIRAENTSEGALFTITL